MKLIIQREPNAACPTNAKPQEFAVPAVNIFENKDGYVLEAEMPGVTKAGLEVTLEGTELTLVGHRSVPALPGTRLFRESGTADYKRVFDLDPAIDTTKIAARMEQGVLTLTLPKSEEVKPRRVSVE